MNSENAVSKYLFIQSRDPFTDKTSTQQFSLMADLMDRSWEVQVILVQDAVIAGRKGVRSAELEALLARGGTVYVDDFSLRQRGIESGDVKDGFKVSGMERVIEAMKHRYKVIWH